MDVDSIPFYQQHIPPEPRTQPGGSSTSKPTFEFTKRKNWDDILLSQLHLTVLLILSLATNQNPSKILFIGCNSALYDVLGYSDSELLGTSFSTIMNGRDSQVWQSIVDDAVRTQNSKTLGMFLRLKRKLPVISPSVKELIHASSAWPFFAAPHVIPQEPAEVLFEIRGHVHFTDPSTSSQSEPLCVLATAIPYPSSVASAVVAFLEQKMENERLRNRLQALQARSDVTASKSPQKSAFTSSSPQISPYAHVVSLPTQPQPRGLYMPISPSITSFDNRPLFAQDDFSASYAQRSPIMYSPSMASPRTVYSPLAAGGMCEDEESRRKRVSLCVSHDFFVV